MTRFVILVGLSVLLMPMCKAQQQKQQAAPRCDTVPIRKLKFELPKDMKGFKRGPSIRYIIESDGSVSHVSLVKSSGNKAVDDAMLDAVKKVVYHSLKSGCDQVETTVTFTIDFTG